MKKYILILVLMFLFSSSIAFAALNCSVGTSCPYPRVEILRMSNLSNAHAELPGPGNYPYSVCCGGIFDLSNQCQNVSGIVVRLSGNTNAHVEENNQTTNTYNGNNACLSVPLSGSVVIGYQDDNCNGYDTMIGSMSFVTTNAHVGDGNAYPRKICASAQGVRQQSRPLIIPKPSPVEILKVADFNKDGRVDILDLSIMLYYFGNETPTSSFCDLNKDGEVDILDVSILFYYWSPN